MQIGTARVEITPKDKIHLQGQMHARIPERTRDPLYANAAALREGDVTVVLVSCDLCMGPDDLVRRVQQACQAKHGITGDHVLIAVTHTHVGPCTVPFNVHNVVHPEYIAILESLLVDVVGQALADLGEAQLFAGEGFVAQMGWNRRGMHGNITDMYYGSWRENFAGLEGPRDGSVPVIFARRPDGTLKLILTGFATHPNCVEGEKFYSADVVGETRRALRQVYGDEVDVVYLTGAAANTAPSVMENNPKNIQPWRGETGVRRSGRYLAGEIMKVIESTIDPMPDTSMRLEQAKLSVPYRQWDPVANERALKGFAVFYYEASRDAWPRIMQEESPTEVRLNVLRIGDVVICTNPSEFYVELGLAIKQASPAKMTIISELTDGYCGYVPTHLGFKRGGYDTWTAPTSKLIPEACDLFVDETKRLLARAFA